VNEIGNMLAMPVEDPVSNIILRAALVVCNTSGHRKKKLKLHLITYLCSTSIKLSVDSVGSQSAVDFVSVLQRKCTARHQWPMTLVSD
jgi:hypothetical protein